MGDAGPGRRGQNSVLLAYSGNHEGISLCVFQRSLCSLRQARRRAKERGVRAARKSAGMWMPESPRQHGDGGERENGRE